MWAVQLAPRRLLRCKDGKMQAGGSASHCAAFSMAHRSSNPDLNQTLDPIFEPWLRRTVVRAVESGSGVVNTQSPNRKPADGP